MTSADSLSSKSVLHDKDAWRLLISRLSGLAYWGMLMAGVMLVGGATPDPQIQPLVKLVEAVGSNLIADILIRLKRGQLVTDAEIQQATIQTIVRSEIAPILTERQMVRYLRQSDHAQIKRHEHLVQQIEHLQESIQRFQSESGIPATQPVGRRDKLFLVPQPPHYFVHRAKPHQEVVDTLTRYDPNAAPSTRRRVLVSGAAGFGKSHLLLGICYDLRIVSEVPEEIIYHEINPLHTEQEATNDIWSTLIEILGEKPYQHENHNRAHVEQLLKGRDCLVVLDGLTDSSKRIAETLLQIDGPRYVIGIQNSVAMNVARMPHTVTLGEMTESEAEELFLSHVPPDELSELTEEEYLDFRGYVRQIAVERLGKWPLVVGLAGESLRLMHSVDEGPPRPLIEVVEELSKRLGNDLTATSDSEEKLDRVMQSRFHGLEDDEKRKFYSLAILRPNNDGKIPESVIQRLFGLSGKSFDRLAGRFRGQYYARVANSIRIHGKVREYLRSHLERSGPDSVTEAHAGLLLHYEDFYRKSLLDIAAEDEYLRHNLVYHWIGAKKFDELELLFADSTWRDLRFGWDDYTYDGYVRDVMDFWSVIHEQREQDDYWIASGAFRQALLRTSINSASANFPVPVIEWALRENVWSPGRVTSLAHYATDPHYQADIYLTLLTVEPVDTNYVSRCWDCIKHASINADTVRQFAALIPHMAGIIAFEEVRSFLVSIDSVYLQIAILAKLRSGWTNVHELSAFEGIVNGFRNLGLRALAGELLPSNNTPSEVLHKIEVMLDPDEEQDYPTSSDSDRQAYSIIALSSMLLALLNSLSKDELISHFNHGLNAEFSTDDWRAYLNELCRQSARSDLTMLRDALDSTTLKTCLDELNQSSVGAEDMKSVLYRCLHIADDEAIEQAIATLDTLKTQSISAVGYAADFMTHLWDKQSSPRKDTLQLVNQDMVKLGRETLSDIAQHLKIVRDWTWYGDVTVSAS